MPVFNYIISIDPGPFWAGRYAYTTPGADPLDHSIFNINVLPAVYQPALLVILAPGGFIILGILIALFRKYQMKKEEKKTGKISAYDGWEKLGACEGCSLRALCGGGNDKVPCAKQKEGDA